MLGLYIYNLSFEESKILQLHARNYTTQDISERENMPVERVSKILCRAKEKARKYIQGEYERKRKKIRRRR